MVASPQLAPTAGNMHSTPTVQLRSPVVSSSQCHCLPMDQQAVCRNLANAYPHLTITIFSGKFFLLGFAASKMEPVVCFFVVIFLELCLCNSVYFV